MENKENLISEIRTLIDNLSQYKEVLEQEDAEGLKELLKTGRELKERLDNE